MEETSASESSYPGFRTIRAQRDRAALARAKDTATRIIRQVKHPARQKKLGFTTADEDIPAIEMLLNLLVLGLSVAMEHHEAAIDEEAIDVDADLPSLLQSEKWKDFFHDFRGREEIKKLVPIEVEKKLIEELETKLGAPPSHERITSAKEEQMEAWFNVAKDALRQALAMPKALHPHDHSPGGRGVA
ncbi:MAG: hypothetical protein KGJ06_04270 [Pseudomonadota bacterium]|nr:hypothetical protein [Pseudomonadota bacterium]